MHVWCTHFVKYQILFCSSVQIFKRRHQTKSKHNARVFYVYVLFQQLSTHLQGADNMDCGTDLRKGHHSSVDHT
jgi:hypothetical protein